MASELLLMTAEQIRSLPRDKTVFFFAVAPLEDHGPHLPVGMDLIEANHLCQKTARRLEQEMPGWVGVIMPPAPLGSSANTSALSITVRPYVLRDWLVDACKNLMSQDFLHFVCITGHLGPHHIAAIEDASKVINRRRLSKILLSRSKRPSLVSFSSTWISARDVLEAPLWSDPQEHGGARDTSVGLAISPLIVSPVYTSLIRQNRPELMTTRLLQRIRRVRSGYWGDPARADAEQGERILARQLDESFPKLRAVLEGRAHPTRTFWSWYSFIPSNQSYFKGWLLASILAILLGSWLYLLYFGDPTW